MENKYIVRVPNVFANLIEIDANNEEEAKQKVKELLTNKENKNDYPLYYEATIPENHWNVILKEEYDKLQEAAQENQEDNKL